MKRIKRVDEGRISNVGISIGGIQKTGELTFTFYNGNPRIILKYDSESRIFDLAPFAPEDSVEGNIKTIEGRRLEVKTIGFFTGLSIRFPTGEMTFPEKQAWIKNLKFLKRSG